MTQNYRWHKIYNCCCCCCWRRPGELTLMCAVSSALPFSVDPSEPPATDSHHPKCPVVLTQFQRIPGTNVPECVPHLRQIGSTAALSRCWCALKLRQWPLRIWARNTASFRDFNLAWSLAWLLLLLLLLTMMMMMLMMTHTPERSSEQSTPCQCDNLLPRCWNYWKIMSFKNVNSGLK